MAANAGFWVKQRNGAAQMRFLSSLAGVIMSCLVQIERTFSELQQDFKQ
jgi:hypothetical protein